MTTKFSYHFSQINYEPKQKGINLPTETFFIYDSQKELDRDERFREYVDEMDKGHNLALKELEDRIEREHGVKVEVWGEYKFDIKRL